MLNRCSFDCCNPYFSTLPSAFSYAPLTTPLFQQGCFPDFIPAYSPIATPLNGRAIEGYPPHQAPIPPSFNLQTHFYHPLNQNQYYRIVQSSRPQNGYSYYCPTPIPQPIDRQNFYICSPLRQSDNSHMIPSIHRKTTISRCASPISETQSSSPVTPPDSPSTSQQPRHFFSSTPRNSPTTPPDSPSTSQQPRHFFSSTPRNSPTTPPDSPSTSQQPRHFFSSTPRNSPTTSPDSPSISQQPRHFFAPTPRNSPTTPPDSPSTSYQPRSLSPEIPPLSSPALETSDSSTLSYSYQIPTSYSVHLQQPIAFHRSPFSLGFSLEALENSSRASLKDAYQIELELILQNFLDDCPKATNRSSKHIGDCPKLMI